MSDTKKISSFRGEYAFLSNFYSAPVYFEGIMYANNEAAFQSAKCLDMNVRQQFANLDPSSAKRKGRHVALRGDWESVKYQVMLTIVRDKFNRNDALGAKLLATGDAYLEEGNTWGDRTWGTVAGMGSNWLGRILMTVRDELRSVRGL